MKVSDYIVHVLKQYDVEYVFGYQGANISHIIDSIGNDNSITFVESYNEQGASFCANSYAQVKKKLGVAIASSGPGATNLISGITNAYFDSIPCLYITGNVGLAGMRKDKAVRQNSFQELDIVAMTKGITKYAEMIVDPLLVPLYLHNAITIALENRMGSVHLDIPHDIQKSEIPNDIIEEVEACYEKKEIEKKKLENFIELYLTALKSSKKPLILLGAGFSSCINKAEGLTFLEKMNIPYVASLLGLTSVNANDDNFVGFIGDYGNRYSNLALYHCDNLLILGSRLDHRQTGADLSKFAPNAKIFRVEIDENELERVKINSQTYFGNIKDFIATLKSSSICFSFSKWSYLIEKWKKDYPSHNNANQQVHTNTFFNFISKKLEEPCIVCGDVGQSQMATAQSFRVGRNDSLLFSGGLGAMGYALPAAIGAKYASPDEIVIAIVGDGGIQMNIQELQMIQRDHLNINIILINNHCLGMIRQYQSLALDARFYGSVIGFENPNYGKIAEAYGLDYFFVNEVESYSKCLPYIKSNKACLIEIGIAMDIQLIPEMGKNIIEQNPPLSNIDLEKIEKESKCI